LYLLLRRTFRTVFPALLIFSFCAIYFRHLHIAFLLYNVDIYFDICTLYSSIVLVPWYVVDHCCLICNEILHFLIITVFMLVLKVILELKMPFCVSTLGICVICVVWTPQKSTRKGLQIDGRAFLHARCHSR